MRSSTGEFHARPHAWYQNGVSTHPESFSVGGLSSRRGAIAGVGQYPVNTSAGRTRPGSSFIRDSGIGLSSGYDDAASSRPALSLRDLPIPRNASPLTAVPATRSVLSRVPQGAPAHRDGGGDADQLDVLMSTMQLQQPQGATSALARGQPLRPHAGPAAPEPTGSHRDPFPRERPSSKCLSRRVPSADPLASTTVASRGGGGGGGGGAMPAAVYALSAQQAATAADALWESARPAARRPDVLWEMPRGDATGGYRGEIPRGDAAGRYHGNGLRTAARRPDPMSSGPVFEPH